ncbi:uncharacterized protein N7515_005779 [Penicillium bovifimosum]|uniref:DNA helicase Pif1-like 2B domain-containing protein n=1 Tax=Penicillium bovifimosum TaxID=126998 RepID=A0A9W9L0G9_9EURO|nr:uncharacterized protein N7515_005779 [Penicillium bovifimosum]KAJ5129740.1 hypothetical protein N7515_005779 [Penicillium bovifimosum]
MSPRNPNDMDEEEFVRVFGITREFMNSLDVPGVPADDMELAVNAPIFLLANVDVKNGLCSGTQCIVVSISEDYVMVKLKDVPAPRQARLWPIPRCNFTVEHPLLPLAMNRKQFPIVLAFATTVYKAQGMTIRDIDIDYTGLMPRN